MGTQRASGRVRAQEKAQELGVGRDMGIPGQIDNHKGIWDLTFECVGYHCLVNRLRLMDLV